MGAPLFLTPELPPGDTCRLDGPEGRHAATVQRLRPGEALLLSDGRGGVARCRVAIAGNGVLDLAVLERWAEPAPRPRVAVAQAIAKGDRGEFAVQAMTEVGVDVIVPWSAARSVARWRDERGERALRRWRTTAVEAAKQARRAWFPSVAAPADTATVCRLIKEADAAYVLHEDASGPLAGADLPREGEILLVVGPEGGVAPEERDAFAAAGAESVRLGPTVLRTSTAGVAALSVVNVGAGRWA
ncbi:MAG: 16S rRNA (uracil(1498)-N(3))-methyltransferase [Micromonosporaceae bacterium]|nr:16S rRNA (uracil(1498)-N(3))-methyltransferase [Micromonosporaceae bacterium]